MTTHGYARVSTRSQDVRAQLAQLRAVGVEHVHTETSSGAGRRPVLEDLVDQVDAGDVVVVVALDRLGRVGTSLVQLVDGLTRRGVGLRSLREGIDTSDPVAGRIVLFVMAALAEAERALIVERTRAGLAAARAAGRSGGRPTVITVDKLGTARRLITDGHTIASAARVVGVSRSTLSRHLV